LEIDGVKVRYIDEGQTDPVLFMRGNSTWSYTLDLYEKSI